jgi:putative pyoverdin transport system ATP-binding/permease protein
MDIIWLLLRASWVRVGIAIAAGLISGGCSAGLIAFINSAIAQGSPQSLIPPFAGLVLLTLVFSSLSQFVLVDLSQDSVYQLRMQLSSRILSAPLQQLERIGPSQLLAVLTEDVQAISNTVSVLPTLCIDIAIICGCLIYLSQLSGWVFVAVVVFLGLAIAFVQILITAAYRYIYLARQEIGQLFKHFKGVTEGTKELKLHSTRRQLFFDEDLQTTAAASRDYTKTAFKISAASSSTGQLLFFTLIGLLLFAAPQVIPNAQVVLPAYILTITYILRPIESIILCLPNLASANVSIQKVNEMRLSLAQGAEIDSVVRASFSPLSSSPPWTTLELKEIVHSYRSEEDKSEDSDSHFEVGPINLTIKAGELVFIVGGNGSGKSTLAKLITGLYAPASGELSLDGKAIVESNREAYRQLFSAVFSDFYLFERLVSAEALTLDAQAQTYLEKLQLEQKVSVQDGLLSTTALSQGQRKRLALLAAYLEDRSIYLFDEWAADQDPIFREIFYTQLLAELKQRGRTVLVISHDDHYFHLADRIVKLDYGRIESDNSLNNDPSNDPNNDPNNDLNNGPKVGRIV